MQSFTIQRKGYNRVEVDSALGELEAKLRRLEEANYMLEKKLSESMGELDQLRSQRSLIEDTIVNATATSQKIIADAEAEAEAIKKKFAVDMTALDNKKRDAENMLKRVEYILESQLALIKTNK